MDKAIDGWKKLSLSGEDILKICKEKTKIMVYSDFKNINHINEILEPFGSCVFLYETKEGYGHWCCLLKRDNNVVEFFDPYGMKIDSELSFTKEYYKDNIPFMTKLLYESGYEIVYNNHKLQQLKDNVNVCGRWCGVRILLSFLDIDDFAKLFSKNKHYDPDWYVTALTVFV